MSEKLKPILDACCGSRMFWFDKNNPAALFMDNRELDDTLCDGRSLQVKPDVVGDFRDMPFENETFRLVGYLTRRICSMLVMIRGWLRNTAYWMKVPGEKISVRDSVNA